LKRKRSRYQQGSLQVRNHGERKMWVLLYRDGQSKRYKTLGPVAGMTKSEAQREQARIIAEINTQRHDAKGPMTFGTFVDDVALPFLRPKWKNSTKTTTENAIRTHLLAEFRETPLRELTLIRLQDFLLAKAATGCSESIVAHCRWNLSNILRLAQSDGYIDRDPTKALYIPRCTSASEDRVLEINEVPTLLGALEFRERVIAHLAIFVGLRPGEILALQRRHIKDDATRIVIEQRIYAGDIDDPKTGSSKRTVAVPPTTAILLREWMELVPGEEHAWVFASENPVSPLRLENLWRRHFKPKLEPKGLDWATFQVMRRTHASLGQDAGIDPKVAADQRGHGIGVSLNVYTKSAFRKKMDAADQLEKAVLSA
jgi:integrase